MTLDRHAAAEEAVTRIVADIETHEFLGQTFAEIPLDEQKAMEARWVKYICDAMEVE